MSKETWNKQRKAVKATQIAFEVENRVARQINHLAAESGLTSSSQIRKLIGLDYSPPKRPRLTVSLSDDDYAILAEKYGVDPQERLEIKRQMMQELIGMFE